MPRMYIILGGNSFLHFFSIPQMLMRQSFFILLIDKHGLPVNQGAHILQITCDMGIIIIIIDKSVKITIIFLSACKWM